MANRLLLAERLQEVFISGKWIANTNYRDQIEKTDWSDAIIRVEGLNSIALLLYHINYYLGGITQVLDGGSLEIRDKYSFDMPEINSEEGWLELKSSFFQNVDKFIDGVKNLDEQRLNSPFVEIRYGTYARNIEGVIEHSYYHLGQIVIIAKIINTYKNEPSNE